MAGIIIEMARETFETARCPLEVAREPFETARCPLEIVLVGVWNFVVSLRVGNNLIKFCKTIPGLIYILGISK